MDNEIVKREKNVNSRVRIKLLDACCEVWTIARGEEKGLF